MIEAAAAVVAALAGFWLGRRYTRAERAQQHADLDRVVALMRAAARADGEWRQ